MIEEYASSVYSALIKDLSDLTEVRRSYNAAAQPTEGEYSRRPTIREIEVHSFPQTWSSTALGFGGIGGQAFTTAQTVVVICGREACVYFGGAFAYKIKKIDTIFYDDIRAFEMSAVSGAQKRYGN
jgi:hypothetical protein